MLVQSNLLNAEQKNEYTSTEEVQEESLTLIKIIRGNIRPKSIVHSGKGRFFAQNMMYRHSITVYDRNYTLLKTIKDNINPKEFGYGSLPQNIEGSPVEVAFNSTGEYAYVSNFKMYGKGFNNPGDDDCDMRKDFDQSFVYKINTLSLEIESIIQVGAVPKYLAVSPNDRRLLVSNWCSGDLSIIDLDTEEEIRRIELGKYPRGIAIDSRSSFAYITLMGEDQIAVLNLIDYSLSWISAYGETPRHVVLDPSNRYLYISLSRPGEVAKVDLVKRDLVKKVKSGSETRSITLGPDGRFLYVVNYEDNSISKLDAVNMLVLETIDVHEKPIGITFDNETKQLWVACYTGSILIYEDKDYLTTLPKKDLNINISSGKQNSLKNQETSRIPKEKKASSFYYVPRPAKLQEPGYYVYRLMPENKTGDKENIKIPAPKAPEKQIASNPKKPATYTPPLASASITERARIAASFHVIVGSYQNEKFANTKAEELKKDGYDTQVLPNEQGGYRVSAGQYSGKNAANEAASTFLQRTGIKAWILKE